MHQPEKAQLHADSVVKLTYELEGEGEVQSVSELPAREPVGNEMEARRGGGRDVGQAVCLGETILSLMAMFDLIHPTCTALCSQ